LENHGAFGLGLVSQSFECNYVQHMTRIQSQKMTGDGKCRWTTTGRTRGRMSEGCVGKGWMSGKWGKQIKYK